MKWIQVFIHVLDKKKLRGKLGTASESLKKALEELKKFLKVPKKETPEQKVTWDLEVTAAKVKATEANTVHVIAIGACYNLFHQLLADDPKFNGTVLLGRSTTMTPGRRWTEQRTRDSR